MVKVFDFDRICGGDEENRTPVRKRCHIDFSERSQCLSLRVGQTQTTAVPPILEKFPLQASRSQPVEYPAIDLLSAHAGDKQTEVSIKLLKRSFRLLLYLKRFHLTDGAR